MIAEIDDWSILAESTPHLATDGGAFIVGVASCEDVLALSGDGRGEEADEDCQAPQHGDEEMCLGVRELKKVGAARDGQHWWGRRNWESH